MSNLSITVEVLPGTDVTVAAREAIDLANRLGVTVHYDFNGVLCIAAPGDDHESLAEQCMSMVGEMEKIRIARGRPRDAQ
jgi:hypothetical protein